MLKAAEKKEVRIFKKDSHNKLWKKLTNAFSDVLVRLRDHGEVTKEFLERKLSEALPKEKVKDMKADYPKIRVSSAIGFLITRYDGTVDSENRLRWYSEVDSNENHSMHAAGPSNQG